MFKINESLLYYVWITKQLDLANLRTIDDQVVIIKNFGTRNMASGPDFSAAMITIGDTTWAGNVEMHVFSSDWVNHGHQNDDAYGNVILHVVFDHDKDINFQNSKPGFHIPTIALKKYIPQHIIDNYAYLLANQSWVPCEANLNHKSAMTFDLWKYHLAIERLEYKSVATSRILDNHIQDWEEVAYTVIARYFGATANSDAFEQLAMAVPLKTIMKHHDNPLAVYALLMGQAGFLSQKMPEDTYQIALKAEYDFLKVKHELVSVNITSWKFGGMMPAGFPTFRLAQMIGLLLRHTRFFNACIEAQNIGAIYELLTCEADPYWENHYIFNRPAKWHSTAITQTFKERLVINAIIPLMLIYGKRSGNQALMDKALGWLDHIPKETNATLKQWQDLGMNNNSALDSQALLQLKKQYCDSKRCLDCRIGHQLVANKSGN